MKHKVDWLSQQYRIRAEYAHRIAIEAWERQIDEARRLMNGPAITQEHRDTLRRYQMDEYAALGHKH